MDAALDNNTHSSIHENSITKSTRRVSEETTASTNQVSILEVMPALELNNDDLATTRERKILAASDAPSSVREQDIACSTSYVRI